MTSLRDLSLKTAQYESGESADGRPYIVYTPLHYQVGTVAPLVVMLHGCTQSVEDFATGTQMNQLAEQHGFIVVYPRQTPKENRNRCWNWFTSSHQMRGRGEPASIAGVVQALVEQTTRWTIDTNRIYVAGISAGASMAVILGATYPDVFAAIGVHSGIEYQAAKKLTDALTVMRRGGPDPALQGQIAHEAMGNFTRCVPTIVFHGTRDSTVSPINGDQTVQQWMRTNQLALNGMYQADFHNPNKMVEDQVPGGRGYTVSTWTDTKGEEIQVYWKVQGLGHAWSGGSSRGSFTDPSGPDASLAMYQFFMDHPLREITWPTDHDGSLWGTLRRTFTSIFKPKSESSAAD